MKALDHMTCDEAAELLLAQYKSGILPDHVLLDFISASFNIERALRKPKGELIQMRKP